MLTVSARARPSLPIPLPLLGKEGREGEGRERWRDTLLYNMLPNNNLLYQFDVCLDFKLQKYYAKPRHSSCSDSLSACIKERFDAWRVRQVRFVHVFSVHNLGDRRSPWMAFATDRYRFPVTSHGSAGLARRWTADGIRRMKRWHRDREVHTIKHIVRHSIERTYRD